MARRIYYRVEVGGTDDASIASALKGSLCPNDADIRVDTATGIVSIETEGPWRADKNGRESGLGVPGWAECGFEGSTADALPVSDLDRAKVAHEEVAALDMALVVKP